MGKLSVTWYRGVMGKLPGPLGSSRMTMTLTSNSTLKLLAIRVGQVKHRGKTLGFGWDAERHSGATVWEFGECFGCDTGWDYPYAGGQSSM